MKVKTNQIVLLAYLLAIFLFTTRTPVIAFALAIILLLFDAKVPKALKNLLYVLTALLPFPVFLVLFLAYLPFSFFGRALGYDNFIKSYVLGYAIALMATLSIFILSKVIHFPLNWPVIAVLFYAPAIVMSYQAHKKGFLWEIISLRREDVTILLIILALLFPVTGIIFKDDTLFISNGTYFYSKYYTIVKSIENNEPFPFYSPYAAQGEQLFLSDSPAMFSHAAFLKSLFPIHPVLFYNYFSAFILFLTMLGAVCLMREMLSGYQKEITPHLIALGASAIGLSFIFVQYLESFKQYLAYPLGLLIFALVLENPQKIERYLLIGALFAVSLTVHATQTVGIFALAAPLFLLTQLREGSLLREWRKTARQLSGKRVFVILALLAILTVPLFYITSNLYYSEFMRGHGKSIPVEEYIPRSAEYVTYFFSGSDYRLFSTPDVRRNDQKSIGIFLSAAGLIAMAISLASIRKRYFQKTAFFILAFWINLLLSSMIVSLPVLGNMEYGYRTIIPYLLVMLVASIITAANIFRGSRYRWLVVAVLAVGIIQGFPLVKANLDNIHKERFISGQYLGSGIEFIKGLPADGRIITYGLYSNAVDAGIHSLTDRYVSRYEFKQFSWERTIYDRIHTSDSWGKAPELEEMSPMEFSNLLRKGGYKYFLADICNPIGNAVGKLVYPEQARLTYQDECLIMLQINGTSYAEQVNIVSEREVEERLDEEGGHRYVAVSDHFTYYDPSFTEERRLIEEGSTPVSFSRESKGHVVLEGEFRKGDWIVFKEEYFPRWSAYMDGDEIPVVSSDNEMLLIKTDEGSRIELIYRQLSFERAMALISLLGLLAMISYLAFFGKKARKDPGS